MNYFKLIPNLKRNFLKFYHKRLFEKK